MTDCDEWIEKISSKLPEECLTVDLIKVGIFTSPFSASCARRAGNSPPYFKFGKKIMYPKPGVIKWLKEHKYESCTKNQSQQAN